MPRLGAGWCIQMCYLCCNFCVEVLYVPLLVPLTGGISSVCAVIWNNGFAVDSVTPLDLTLTPLEAGLPSQFADMRNRHGTGE
jgi:hypothetical protein